MTEVVGYIAGKMKSITCSNEDVIVSVHILKFCELLQNSQLTELGQFSCLILKLIPILFH